MKLTDELIETVVIDVVGEDAMTIVNYLKDKSNVNEFEIAEKTEIEIQPVRNILYRLYENNLANYYRKKDRQKGWYISYWTFNDKRVLELVPIIKKKKLEGFQERLDKEMQNVGTFYLCPNLCKRLDFDNAVEFQFKCPECGSLLNQQDNSRTIEFLKNKIEEIETEN